VGTLGSRVNKPTVIIPRGTLRVGREIYPGVILRLPPVKAGSKSASIEAHMREHVRGPVRLLRDADGQWVFMTQQGTSIALRDVAEVPPRKAA
jgi:hypothetical protein